MRQTEATDFLMAKYVQQETTCHRIAARRANQICIDINSNNGSRARVMISVKVYLKPQYITSTFSASTSHSSSEACAAGTGGPLACSRNCCCLSCGCTDSPLRCRIKKTGRLNRHPSHYGFSCSAALVECCSLNACDCPCPLTWSHPPPEYFRRAICASVRCPALASASRHRSSTTQSSCSAGTTTSAAVT